MSIENIQEEPNQLIVGLVHSYLLRRVGNLTTADSMSTTGVVAAAKLYELGMVDKLVFTVEEPIVNPQLRILKSELGDLYNEDDIIVTKNTLTTVSEILEFKRIAESKGWKRLVTIANHEHLPRVNRLINKFMGDMSVSPLSAKQILNRYEEFDYVIGEMDSKQEQIVLAKQERILNWLVKIPILGEFLVDVVTQKVPSKARLQIWMWEKFLSNSKR